MSIVVKRSPIAATAEHSYTLYYLCSMHQIQAFLLDYGAYYVNRMCSVCIHPIAGTLTDLAEETRLKGQSAEDMLLHQGTDLDCYKTGAKRRKPTYSDWY